MSSHSPAATSAPGGQPKKELPPDYYLRNFHHLLDHVLAHSAGVFSREELNRFAAFSNLSADGRKLYVRLYLRRSPLFRASRLVYPEIGHVDAALEELAAGGWARLLPIPACAETAVAPLLALTLGELRALARHVRLSTGGRKCDVVARLAAAPEAWPGIGGADRFIELGERTLFAVAHLLFFGNRRQDLSEFVLADLDRARYPSYTQSCAPALFPDRAALDAYTTAVAEWEAGVCGEDAAELERVAWRAIDALEHVPPPEAHQWRVSPGRYHARLALDAARALERLGLVETAVALYERIATRGVDLSTRVTAADRCGLLAGRMGRESSYAALVEGILAAPELDAIARYTIDRRRARLGLSENPDTVLARARTVDLQLEPAGHHGSKALYRSRRGDPVTIEAAVLEALGGDGLMAENALFRTLFGLLFWDAIFAPVPGMFQHPFQDAPLDVSTEYFFINRKDLILARLDALRDADIGDEVARAWAEHRGKINRFAHWETYSVSALARCARTLGAPLLGLLGHLARHPKRHGRGMPDLLVWTGEAPVLVEVKGPGDQLSVEQRLWHDALVRSGHDVRVARVHRPAVKRGE